MLSVAFYITVMLSVVMLLLSVIAPSYIRLESNMKEKKFYNFKLGRQQQNLPGRVPGHDVPIRRPAGVSAL